VRLTLLEWIALIQKEDSMNAPKPKLFDYLSATSYLMDCYQYRKSTQPGFSFESWTTELGFQSRSYLRMMLIGRKKITSRFIEAFVRCEKMTAAEVSYFEILVHYTQAKSNLERQNYGQSLMKILKTNLGQEEISDHVDFIANPLLPRLLVMLSFEDVLTEPRMLSFLMNAPLVDVDAALKTLESLNLAEKIEADGVLIWRSKKTMFKVPDNLGSVPLARFHEQSLQEAIQAFVLPKETRKYKSLLLPLSADEFQNLNQMISDFTAEAIAKFRSNSYRERRVYQLNLNVFPVTQKLDVAAAPM
jgi:uncharacterized protein (TIGR02147 family)